MTPTTYIFPIPLDHTLDHYVSHASRQLSFFKNWQAKDKKVLYLQFSILESTQANVSNNSNNELPPKFKKLHHQTHKTSVQHEHPQKIRFLNHEHISPFTERKRYQIEQRVIVGFL